MVFKSGVKKLRYVAKVILLLIMANVNHVLLILNQMLLRLNVLMINVDGESTLMNRATVSTAQKWTNSVRSPDKKICKADECKKNQYVSRFGTCINCEGKEIGKAPLFRSCHDPDKCDDGEIRVAGLFCQKCP